MSDTVDVVIVGGGIIGLTLAKKLSDIGGISFDLIDRRSPMSGTRASGGHIKESWSGAMTKRTFDESLNTLNDIWGVIEEKFIVYPKRKRELILRVDTDVVMETLNNYNERVVSRLKGLSSSKPSVVLSNGEEIRCRLLIVAAGVGVPSLLSERFGEDRKMEKKKGISFRVEGKLKNGMGFVVPWCPYKQIVAHQQDKDKIWIGDGISILAKNWSTEREKSCEERCLEALGEVAKHKNIRRITGTRAYVQHNKSHPCVFEQVGKAAYLATGAGKAGTIAAGWVTNRILRKLSILID